MFEPSADAWVGQGAVVLPRARGFMPHGRAQRGAPAAIDPIEVAEAAGYAAGLAAGRAEAAQRDAQVDRLTALIAEHIAPPAGAIEALLGEAARRIGAALCGDPANANIAALITQLAAGIDAECALCAIHLSPADGALCAELQLPAPVIADADVPVGCVRLRTANGWIEDGAVFRLQRFVAAIARGGDT